MTALKRFDLTQDGVAELIAGREDGTVSVRCRTSSMGGSAGTEAGLEDRTHVYLLLSGIHVALSL